METPYVNTLVYTNTNTRMKIDIVMHGLVRYVYGENGKDNRYYKFTSIVTQLYVNDNDI